MHKQLHTELWRRERKKGSIRFGLGQCRNFYNWLKCGCSKEEELTIEAKLAEEAQSTFIAWNFPDKEIIISALVAHQCTRARWFSISGLMRPKEKVPVLRRGFKAPLVLVPFAMPKGRGPEKVKHSQHRRQRSSSHSGLSQAGFHLRRQLAMKNRLMTPFTHSRQHTPGRGVCASVGCGSC